MAPAERAAGQAPRRRAPSEARVILRRLRPSLTFLGVLPVVAALYFAQGVLIPIALAVLFAFLLSPPVGMLERAGLGRLRGGRVAAVLVVGGLVFSLLGGGAWIIGRQVSALSAELPQYRSNLLRKIAELRWISRGGPLAQMQSTTREVLGKLQESGAPSGEGRPLPVVVKPEGDVTWPVPRIMEAVSTSGFVVALVMFMLLERRQLRSRLVRLAGQRRLADATTALDEAGARISRYLMIHTLINASYGVAIGAGLGLIGVPYAALGGTLAFIFRFIPYLGPPMAAAGPIVMSLAVFDGWQRPLATIGLFFAVELVTYLFVEPLVYGRAIGVSQAALLVALGFWTWLWGPIGLILGTPLTVCLVVLGKHMPALQFVSALMTDEPAPPWDVVYYERLLARDRAESAAILESFAAEHSLDETYDDVLVPAVCRAKADEKAGRVSREEAHAMYRQVRAGVETLARRRVAAARPAPTRHRDGRPRVILCAVGGEAEDVALAMLGRMLSRAACAFELNRTDRLSGEIVSQAVEGRPAAVLIASLMPDGLAQTRHLCKRLRACCPTIPILVGRWGGKHPDGVERETFEALGAVAVGATLRQSRDQIVERLSLEPSSRPRGLVAAPARA